MKRQLESTETRVEGTCVSERAGRERKRETEGEGRGREKQKERDRAIACEREK